MKRTYRWRVFICEFNSMSQTRWSTRAKLEAKRKRKLHQLSQKFGVLDKLPEVIRTRHGFLKRRNAILSIAHKGAQQ